MGRDELTPFFRTPSQGRVLAAVLLARPEDRLERYGLVTSERFAQARVVRPNERSAYLGDLRSLVLKAYGPAVVLGELLAPLDGIEAAYVFGSWAARLAGETG